MRKALATLAVTAAAFAVPMLGAGTAYADTTDAQAALGSCTGNPVAVDGYGVCITNATITVFGGKVVWTPGVDKQYVNTPQVGPVPAQSIGTPIVTSEGFTVPPIVVQAPLVTPCVGC